MTAAERVRAIAAAACAATRRGSAWIDALAGCAWLAGFGLGGAMLLYGAPALAPSQHLNFPNVATPGLMCWVINWPLRVTLFGTVLTAFMLRLWDHRSVPREQRLGTLSRLLRCHADSAALGVLCIIVLGGLREVLQAELFDSAYGRNLYVGPLDGRELLGAACVSACALLAFVAIGSTKPADDRQASGGIADASPSRATACVVAMLLVTVWVRGAMVGTWSPQDRHMEALTMHTLLWELIVAALLLLADDPLARARGWTDWIRRNRSPLRLLVSLELLRVAGRTEWYLDMQWLPPHGEHGAERIFFFDGRLDNVVALACQSVMLAGGIAALLFHLVPRKGTHASVDGDAR